MDKIILQDVVNNAPKPVSQPKQSFLTKERREERRFEPQQSLEYKVSSQGKSKKWIIIIAILVLLIGGFAFASARNAAEVLITPTRAKASIDSNLKAYRTPEAPQLLSYTVVELASEQSATVPASGNKFAERKASGKIMVTNSSSESIKIISNTRFKSADGKIFRANNAFNIAIGKSLEVAVVADAPGVEYNIGPSTFTLPGLAGGPLADKVKGVSSNSMSGGFKGDMKIVSDKDLAEARANLEGALTQKLLDQVNSSLDATQIFFGETYSTTFKFNENAEGGDATDATKQNVSLEGKIYAIVFDRVALASTIGRRESVDSGSDEIDIENWDAMSITMSSYQNLGESSEVSIRVTGDASFVWKIDVPKIASELAGIDKDSYSSIFLNYTSVDKAEVSIKPFWRGTFPKDPSRIHITIKPS